MYREEQKVAIVWDWFERTLEKDRTMVVMQISVVRGRNLFSSLERSAVDVLEGGAEATRRTIAQRAQTVRFAPRRATSMSESVRRERRGAKRRVKAY